MKGIININKPPGMTSHDVVNNIRKIIKIKKVGHTGTLDPLAKGVLPICIGQATKISQFMIEKDKEYITEITLGAKTDTYDTSGKIILESDIIPKEEELISHLKSFIGNIRQIPPIYSAIKVYGKKLYEYARENIEVAIPPREVTVHSISLLEYQYPKARLKIYCSKGTYIRSICNDLGETLGSYGHVHSLIRTKSGPFNIENAIDLTNLQQLNNNEIEALLYPMDYPLKHLTPIDVKEASSKYLLNGTMLIQKNCFQILSQLQIKEIVRIYLNKEFKGLGEITQDYQIKPLRIFK